MCLSFLRDCLVFVSQICEEKFENKISKIELLKGIFASMTMYQQKQCYSKHQQTRSKLLINKRKQKRKKASLGKVSARTSGSESAMERVFKIH